MSYKTPFNCLKCSPVLIFMLFCLPCFSQYNFGEVDQLLKENQKTLGNNYAVIVWKDGKAIYQKQNTDFTAKTEAPVGNAGNWLTAALVMTFVDEGKLSLDDKVSKYIPIFETYMKGYITIRNCLSNTTGIDSKGLVKGKFGSLEEVVAYYASKREIAANPGTEFYYSDFGPNIAGRVLEIITKKSFDRLMQERILRPLKMHSTSFSNEEGGAVDPAGGARASALDYINFLSMLLNKGMFDSKRVLSEKAITEMQTAQFPTVPVKYSPKSAEGAHYGLGAWIQEADASGNSNVLSSPSLYGTWPYIDKCRNYAAIILVQGSKNEQKKDLFLHFKELVDVQLGAGCK